MASWRGHPKILWSGILIVIMMSDLELLYRVEQSQFSKLGK